MQISTTVIMVLGIGAAIGVIGGGLGGQWLYNRKKEWLVLLSGITMLLGIGPAMFLVNADLSR